MHALRVSSDSRFAQLRRILWILLEACLTIDRATIEPALRRAASSRLYHALSSSLAASARHRLCNRGRASLHATTYESLQQCCGSARWFRPQSPVTARLQKQFSAFAIWLRTIGGNMGALAEMSGLFFAAAEMSMRGNGHGRKRISRYRMGFFQPKSVRTFPHISANIWPARTSSCAVRCMISSPPIFLSETAWKTPQVGGAVRGGRGAGILGRHFLVHTNMSRKVGTPRRHG